MSSEHNQGFTPGHSWGSIKHVKRVKFHLSGPPRKLADERDSRGIGGSQLQQIRELEERDRRRSLGTREAEFNAIPLPPLKVEIPARRPALWYWGKGMESGRIGDHATAYHFFMAAAGVKSIRPSERRRYEECARSNQKAWASANRMIGIKGGA